MTHSLCDFQSSGVIVLEVLVVCLVNQSRDCHLWGGMSGEGRLCHFRSAVRWMWFVGVPVRTVPLGRQPRVALLESGRYWIVRCWIVLRIELPYHQLRMTLLESLHYWSHLCWNARPTRFAVLFQTPSSSCPGPGFGSA